VTKPLESLGPHARRHQDAPPASSFVYRIRVAWGDCDPVRIAYTARIPEWALDALEAWWHHTIGLNWYTMQAERQLCTPFVHMKMDFRSPVTPRHPLECEVVVSRLGHRSIAHRVYGRQDGVLCFEGDHVAVFVDAVTMKPHTPPDDIVAMIRASMPAT
jgi:4-hydroxybenzoyl-CoA thioesterase